MKSIYNYLKGSFCLIAVLLLVMGCSEKYEYDTDYSFYDNVTLKVNLVDENDVLAVRLANKTHLLTIATVPEDVFIASTAYIYELADNSIASISIDGTLTLHKVGETKLTVKFRGNQNISTSCTLRVEPTLISDLIVAEGNGIKVEEGKTLDLARYVAIIPSDADNQNLRYEVKTGSENFVRIDEGSSIVNALSKGTATIVVSATDDSGVSTELTVEVTGKIPVEEIILGRAGNLTGKTFAIGQIFDIGSVLTVEPANASDPTLVYELVSGDGVVTLDAENGIVTTIGTGDAEIKISAHDGFEEAVPQVIKFKVDGSLTWYERAFWFVDTEVIYDKGDNYVPDNAGGGQPEKLIDGNANSFFALTKPTKGAYDGFHAHPKDALFGFIVDLGGRYEFNQLKWTHRNSSNVTTNFQAFKIKVFGSDDNENWTVLEESMDTKSPGVAEKELPLSATYIYRYIKVEYIDYDTQNGSLLCVAEFNVGKK